ncbi:TetR/AcrR family transcriptional regulator [Roseomonas gilardii]|uniref:TetR/AcrR family transcriptional regulator n=1 Tax=Roseomonas gilardii TaxID=257708 RepID=A0ABU3MF34_9PROT|nr:TetR/AcrR family transcriptional regulator [Roseomonas gilardii]MDT8331380.1 TetR/AcrR family transcriptional regulator [Roseomonas gilardii]
MSEARTGQTSKGEPERDAAGNAGPPDKRPVAQRVREAARELFYRQGIHATGVDEICRVAGTTKMGLYRAYPSKDALIETILQERCEAQEKLACATGDDSLSPRERLLAFVNMAAATVLTPGFRGCPLGLAIAEFPDPGHPARQVADHHKQAMRETLRRLCAEAGAPATLGDSLQLLIEGAFAVAPALGNEAASRSLESSAHALIGASLPG